MLWNTQSTLNMLWLQRVATIAVRPPSSENTPWVTVDTGYTGFPL